MNAQLFWRSANYSDAAYAGFDARPDANRATSVIAGGANATFTIRRVGAQVTLLINGKEAASKRVDAGDAYRGIRITLKGIHLYVTGLRLMPL